eukprot:747706-Hanusia_phi.AAC.4
MHSKVFFCQASLMICDSISASLAMRKFLFKHIAAAQTRGGAVDLGASTRSEPSNAPVAGKHGDSQQAASHRRPVVKKSHPPSKPAAS